MANIYKFTRKSFIQSEVQYSQPMSTEIQAMFLELKRAFKDTHFKSDNEVKTAITSFIKSRQPKFSADEMEKLVTH